MNGEIFNILFNFLPEITLALTIIILNIISAPGINKSGSSYYIFLCGFTLSLIFTLIQAYYAPQYLFTGTFSADHFAYGGRTIITAAMLIIAAGFYKKQPQDGYNLILVSVIGALLSVSASDIFVLFISLQVMLIPLYLIIYYTIKPAVKYFIFSSIVMASMLYGFTLLYGISQTGNMTGISAFLSFNPYNNSVLIFAVILVLCGLTFTALAAPFNLIFPLLSEKIRHPHLAQFTIINVITVLFVSTRFFTTIFRDQNTFITDKLHFLSIGSINWQTIIAIISAASLIAGNFVILWQYDLKKIFSYISIAQAGYIFMGIISGTPDGLAAVIFNIVIFTINSVGLLYCIKLISQHYNVTDITGLKGLGGSDKFLFLTFIFFLISSAGFPLTGGFTGKILLYISLGSTNYFWLIAAGILSSMVFLYFIFRLSVSIFSGKSDINPPKTETLSLIILLILLIPAILLGFYFVPVLDWSKYCSNLLGI